MSNKMNAQASAVRTVLTTSSEAVAEAYMQFLRALTGKQKRQGRNKRDGVYNIMVWTEDAQAVVRALYYESCLALPRKLAKARIILAWQRPDKMKQVKGRKPWTPEQDRFLLSHTNEEAMAHLGRNYNSVHIRRGRLVRSLKKQQVTD
jgi:hypothetical protein